MDEVVVAGLVVNDGIFQRKSWIGRVVVCVGISSWVS